MSKLTRRRFVGGSLAAAAAASLMPRTARAVSANEELGVAVVGVNSRGGSHLNGFISDPRTRVLYVVDVDERAGAPKCDVVEAAQGFRPKWVADMREAFDDPAVNIVSTATPNHWHALCGIWAMQAGKDVYIEKPVCYNIAEGTALIAAARKHERMCQVGTQCRSNPALRDGMQFLHDGGIGELKFARGLCYKRRQSIGALGDYPIPETVDFNLWSGPAPFTEPRSTRQRFHYDWHWQRHYGNGDLGNQGPHQTDIARWGLGIDGHPNSVICYGGRLGYQAERDDPDYIDGGDTGNTEVSIYDYGDKCIVFETRGLEIKESADTELNRLFQSTSGNKVGVVFYGSEGYMLQASYSNCIVYDKDMNEVRRFTGGNDQLHFENFINACQSRKVEDLHADVREGHLSAAISHLGNISYYMGEKNFVSPEEAAKVLEGVSSLDDNQDALQRTLRHLTDNGVDLEKYPISMGPLLKFDPEREIFPDDPYANVWLSREYRPGFEVPSPDKV